MIVIACILAVNFDVVVFDFDVKLAWRASLLRKWRA